MLREVRRPFRRAGVALLWVAASVLPASCAKIWGIDDGIPFPPDSSTLDANQGQDVTTQDSAVEAQSDAPNDATDAPDAGDALDAADASDVSDASDASDALDAAPEACTPDLNWCETHCGQGPDNCGIVVGCGQCGAGQVCAVDAGNVCACQSDPTFCNNRCGSLFDNCDASVTCPDCPTHQTCNAGTCSGCTPEGSDAACGNQPCGSTTNNCGQTVYCGNGGSCANSQEFCTDASACCLPDNSACQTTFACGGSFVNNCGQNITCPSCAINQICFQGACCTPPSCAEVVCGTVTACGSTVQCLCPGGQQCSAGACIPINPPPDGGQDGGADGGCLSLGSPCSISSQCCSDSCGVTASPDGGGGGGRTCQ